MRRMLGVGAVVGSLAAIAADAGAQSWRTAQLGRTASDNAPLAVSVRYAAGDFAVRSAPRGWLYEAALTYDADGSNPRHRFDPAARTLAVELDRGTMHWPGARSRTAELRLALGTDAPLELDLEAGAVSADVDLTGLRVRSLAFATGFSDATLHFDRPNAERITDLTLRAFGSRLQAVRLANARTERVSLHARGTLVVLDLTGQWTGDMTVHLDARLSRVVVRVPDDVGIRYTATGRFSGAPSGLVQRGEALVSDNHDIARHHLIITGAHSIGQLVVERISR